MSKEPYVERLRRDGVAEERGREEEPKLVGGDDKSEAEKRES